MMQQLRPLFDQIVVREIAPGEMRESGLVVPMTAHHHPPQEGIVVAAGDGVDWWRQAGVEMPVAVGDHVLFPWNAGVYVEVGEERLLVLRVGALLGVLDDVPSAGQVAGRDADARA